MWRKNRKLNKNKHGFTLIEILISSAILFLIITGVVVFSIQTIEAHTKSRAMQNAIENARFAIEGLSKRIRTSHNVSKISDQKIKIVDNVSPIEYTYNFDGSELTVQEDSGPIQDLVGGANNIDVTGRFYVVPTDAVTPDNNNQRGFVRISMTITYSNGSGNPAESDSVTIQSGVSLRDYGEDGGS